MLHFLKNKKGNTFIYGVMLLPLIAVITFVVIFGQMEKVTKYKNVQTTLDNIGSYIAKTYGQTKVNSDEKIYCTFKLEELLTEDILNEMTPQPDGIRFYWKFNLQGIDETNPNAATNRFIVGTFMWDLFDSFKKIEGINKYWTIELTISSNQRMVDGKEVWIDKTKPAQNEYIILNVEVALPKSGFKTIENYAVWYQENAHTWQSIQENNSFVKYQIEVNSSCV